MPFTLAHPAAVVPIYKARPRWFVFSALVIGSIIPDTEYFVRGELVSVWSHTIPGLLVYCLPVGLLLLWLYHTIQKNILLSLMPLPLQSRLAGYNEPFPFLPWPRLIMIAGSLLIGAATHLTWDSFTHANNLMAQWSFPIATVLITRLGLPITAQNLLQEGNTLIGLLLLAYWGWQTTPEMPRMMPPPIKPFHLIGLVVSSLLFASVFALHLQSGLSPEPFRRWLQQVILSLVPAVYVTVTLYGFTKHFTALIRHEEALEIYEK
jgi:hypothetical protein